MEERRLLLAVALSLLVLTAYQLLFPPPPESASDGVVPQATATSAPAAPAESPTGEPAEPAEPVAVGAAPTPGREVAPVADERERRVEVRTEQLAVGLTNRGGEVLSWRLRDYLDHDARPEEMVQTYPEGWLPLALESGDPELDSRLRGLLFAVSAHTLEISGDDSATLEFRYAEPGLEVEKQLRFRGRGYLTGVSARLVRDGRERPVRVVWGPGIGNPTEAERGVQGYQPPAGVLLSRDDEVERFVAADLDEASPFAGGAWAGVESQYFAALWVPQRGSVSGMVRRVEVPGEKLGELLPAPLTGVELGPDQPSVELYVGPKDYFQLAEVHDSLSRVVPVGTWIGPIVVALMRLLRWVHGHLANYGWSIVALTIMINLLMAPLRHFSISNGIRMAKLAPEMRVIQERYRKVPALDPKRQEMQKEVAALYARHGMSMSTQLTVGCLPLLLTMPFLFAFYRVLQTFIELRGSDFLWIPDLSQPDPLFVTPVLMGASMFLMQRMMPTTMDPAQQRMMMIMPIVLLGMFLWAPSGLNLYWLSSNVCSMVQQGITLKILKSRGEGPLPGPGASGRKPALKTAAKSGGKGRRR